LQLQVLLDAAQHVAYLMAQAQYLKEWQRIYAVLAICSGVNSILKSQRLRAKHRVFFSGDSGYSSDFAKIGAAYGPFDATLIKIGAYGPGEFWQDVHMTPEEAMQTHLDLGGKVV